MGCQHKKWHSSYTRGGIIEIWNYIFLSILISVFLYLGLSTYETKQALAPFLFITQGPPGKGGNNWKLKYFFRDLITQELTEAFSIYMYVCIEHSTDSSGQPKWGWPKICICHFCHFGLLQTCLTCLLPLRIFLVLD